MYERGRGFKMRKVFYKNKLNSVVARVKKILTGISAKEIFILTVVVIFIVSFILYKRFGQEKFSNVMYGSSFVMVIFVVVETYSFFNTL